MTNSNKDYANIYSLIDEQYQSIIVNNPETKILERDMKTVLSKIDNDNFSFTNDELNAVSWVLEMEINIQSELEDGEKLEKHYQKMNDKLFVVTKS